MTSPKKSNKSDNDFFDVHRQGFLLKEPTRGMRKRLVRYWFVLFENKDQLAFLFFQSEDHFLERKKNEGFFRIDDAASIDVLSEYMGRKNAFAICTPRNTYRIVSESRYELHQWLVVLHEAQEKFKKRKEEEKQRKAKRRSVRQRAGSLSTDSASTTTNTYPRIKPTRKAPPVPKAKKDSQEEEAASVAANGETAEAPTEQDDANLESIMADLMVSTQELQAAMEYSMTEEEPHTGDTPEESNTPSELTFTGPDHSTPTPDNILDPIKHEEEKEQTQEKLTGSSEELSEVSTSMIVNSTGSGKKRASKKRSTSIKRRSVSPPNVPPPPPPSFENEVLVEENHADLVDGETQPTSSSAKEQQKYKQVMDSYNEIDSELTEITSKLSVDQSKPKPNLPTRTTSLTNGTVETVEKVSTVNDYLDEAFNDEDSIGIDDKERSGSMEVLVDTPLINKPKKLTKPARSKSQDGSQTYEPRIDQEFVPTSVAEAKLKLFGQKEKDTARFSKTLIQNQTQRLNTNNNNGDEGFSPLPTLSTTDDLLHSIEDALQTTSYMEQQSIAKPEENTYESPWDKKPVARYSLADKSRARGVSFSAELNHRGSRKNGSLERKNHRSAGSPQPPSTENTSSIKTTSAQSMDNINVQRSSTFSVAAIRHKPHKRSLTDIDRRPEYNAFPRKITPPVAPKKIPISYNTLPNWRQLQSSGTQIAFNSTTQNTVYRSLV